MERTGPVRDDAVRGRVGGEWIGPDYGEWGPEDYIDYDYVETEDYGDRPEPLLRREFDLEREVEQARIHISGMGCYELYLSGERVGDRVLEPAQTQYDETVLYSSYDVTEYLGQGTNVIGVALGRLRFGEMVEDDDYGWPSAPWWSDPQVIAQLNVEFADGGSTSLVTNGEWRLTDGPTRFNSLVSGEVYDAREERSGWTQTDFDDGDWESPTTVEAPTGDLTPQRVQPMRENDSLSPVSRSNPEEDVYVFDFGQIMTGWAELTMEGEAGTEITVSYGEKLRDDGTVDNTSVYGLFYAPIQRDHYITNGDGEEQWAPSYSYKGFRYVEVKGFPGEPNPSDIEAKHVYTAFDEGVESDFSCSNDLLNQIHENTLWAYRNNMQGLPTDTPKYEKNGWTGDARQTAVTGMYNFDMARFWQKWLRDMGDSQRNQGETPTIAPTPGYSFLGNEDISPSFVLGPTPGWDAAYFQIPWWMYQHNGDEELLVEYYEGWKQYIDWIQRWSEGGILGSLPNRISHHEEPVRRYQNSHILPVGLGDWGDAPLTDTGSGEVAITSTAFYYRFTQVLAEAATALGEDEEAAEWETLGEEILADFNEEFLDTDRGYYRTGDFDAYLQTSNLFALNFDMVPEEYEDAVVANLVENIMETHDGHLNTATLGTKFILPVLSERGHHDVAYTVATQTDFPSWGNWIEAGRTSLLEYWGLDSRSWNHHFLGVIDEWFYEHLAGIQVEKPGSEHLRIAPKPAGDLKSASGTTETVRGVVESSWELIDASGSDDNGQGLSLNVTVPGNAMATVEIPTLGNDRVRIREGGQNIWNNGNETGSVSGVHGVSRDGNRVLVEVGSGGYHFELERIGNNGNSGD